RELPDHPWTGVAPLHARVGVRTGSRAKVSACLARPALGEPPPRRPAHTAVGSQHDVRIEHARSASKSPAAGSGEEGVDSFSLASQIGVGNRARLLHPTPCAARELPCRGRGAPHDGSDLLEGMANMSWM